MVARGLGLRALQRRRRPLRRRLPGRGAPRARREPSAACPRRRHPPGERRSPTATAASRAAPADLNPRYTFERFVIGPHNEYASAVAHSVAESPATAYNPVFIYADTGLGKTHLIQAIAHAAVARHPRLQFKYVTMERFTDDFINAVSREGPHRGLQAGVPQQRHPARRRRAVPGRRSSRPRSSSSTRSTPSTRPASRSSSPRTGRRASWRSSRSACAPASARASWWTSAVPTWRRASPSCAGR